MKNLHVISCRAAGSQTGQSKVSTVCVCVYWLARVFLRRNSLLQPLCPRDPRLIAMHCGSIVLNESINEKKQQTEEEEESSGSGGKGAGGGGGG